MSTLGAITKGSSSPSVETNHHISCLEHMSDIREVASRLSQQASDLYKELHGKPYSFPEAKTEAAKNSEGFFCTATNILNMTADSLKDTMAVLSCLR